MNSVNLIGRLTADAEINEYKRKGSKEDLTVSAFTVAVDRIGSDEADFIRCKAFGKTAEFVNKYFSKGSRIGLSGRIQTGKYDDDDGETHYTTEVIVERTYFADGKKVDPDDDEEEKPRGRSRKKGGK